VSLRARLLIVLAALAVVGLLAADIATYAALKSSLVDRVDSSLVTSAGLLERGVEALARGPGRGPSGGDLAELADRGGLEGLLSLAPGVFVELRGAGGEVLLSGMLSQKEAPPIPTLPDPLPPPAGGGPVFTAAAESGDTEFRVLARPLSFGGTLVVASPLDDVEQTLDRLVVIEVIVSLAVVAGIVGLGLYLVRVGLRPLRRIEETAGAIAAGDLSRRIENAGERTEVGRLGLALNAMLARIEQAFAERAASEQRLRRFVGDASHELRTPLAAVQAYAELFDRGARDRPEDLMRAMHGIERESRRMGLLVDDLLLLARLDQGRPLERKQVDLTEVAGEALDAARALEPARPFALDAPEPVVVPGDPARLRQVVDNLLANVRAHTPPSAAATVRVAGENGMALVEVADEGPGLSEERAAHVFERFYRGDPSRSRDGGGSGLGLAIVAAIAKAHGGNASVVSGTGHGATFRVSLPLDGFAEASGRSPAGVSG
jgi:two-component system OmpR family sensor kinase